MGVSYREEIKKRSKAEARQAPGADPARCGRGRAAAKARSEAIKRQQGRKAVHHRTQQAEMRLYESTVD